MELHNLKEAKKAGKIEAFLNKFVDDNTGTIDFSDVDYFVRQELVSLIEEEYDKGKWNPFLCSSYINTIRLISRDEKNLNIIFESDKVKHFLLCQAKLPEDHNHTPEYFVYLEALKCLVNALFKSREMRSIYKQKSHESMKNMLNGFAGKTTFSTEETMAYNMAMRILFVTTALQLEFRSLWATDDYLNVLISILEQSLSLALIGNPQVIQDARVRVSEVLKIMFNLYCKGSPTQEQNAPMLILCKKVLLSVFGDDSEVCQNVVNLIFTLPVQLDIVCPQSDERSEQFITFQNREMSIMKILLKKMEERIDNEEYELCTMYITALLRYCVACQPARRYVRLLVLPPLTANEVQRHPDEGNTLRNKLIRVMKNTGNASTVASELMFVLCKRSVSRMIKYTGFGHSAGLLANSGLLGQINAPRSDENSEDSETEEYAAVESKINPVTGCIRPNLPDPLEGMSEEQKMFEADKLMNHLNQLLDAGMIKPATIGEDGTARPVKHVLELTKNAPDVEEEDSD